MKSFQQLWSDLNTGKTHLIKNDSEKNVRNDGTNNAYFVPNISGFFWSKERYKYWESKPSMLPVIPDYLKI